MNLRNPHEGSVSSYVHSKRDTISNLALQFRKGSKPFHPTCVLPTILLPQNLNELVSNILWGPEWFIKKQILLINSDQNSIFLLGTSDNRQWKGKYKLKLVSWLMFLKIKLSRTKCRRRRKSVFLLSPLLDGFEMKMVSFKVWIP